jgi:SAM-dependent methyltransferase
MKPLTELSTHFDFGQNWSAFVDQLPDVAVDDAVTSFQELIPAEEIAGCHMLDIGCGSGLHSLAALRLGAAEVTAVDIDPVSVATTRRLLSRFAPQAHFTVNALSVFETGRMPKFDVVYSWGVLHHTGDMDRAIRMAADRVAPGGLLCIALYRRTLLCSVWRLEKRIYMGSPQWVRRMIEAVYVVAFRFAFTVAGRDFQDYVNAYRKKRGMDWITDVRDWLGGYPYESISEADALRLWAELNFTPIRRNCLTPGLGLLGTGCDEYVLRRE